FQSTLDISPEEWRHRSQATEYLGYAEKEIARHKVVLAQPPRVKVPDTVLKDPGTAPQDFANLRAVAAKAVQLGDSHRFYAALGEMTQRFDFDALGLQEAVLRDASPGSPGLIGLASDLLIESMMTGRDDILARARPMV